MRQGLFLVALLAGVLALAPSAFAQTCETAGTCEPYEVAHSNTLTVTPPSAGTITGEGIACPGDCTQTYNWSETCTPMPRQDECFGDPPTVTLTAARGPGWTASWSGCDDAGSNQCTAVMVENRTVSVSWLDTGEPNVGFAGAPSKAGPSTVFTASASDNAQVSQVRFYVNDILRVTDGSAPYQANLNVEGPGYAHGEEYTLKVIAVDTSGNASSPLDSAPARLFTVDKQTGLSAVGTTPAFTNEAPTVTFTPPDDLRTNGVTCRTKFGSSVQGTTTGCSSPYTAQLGASPLDGTHTIEITVEDDVGNLATVTRSFVLDRAGPRLDVSWPREGLTYTAPFTPEYTVTDGFTPSDQIAVTCALDGGPYGPCGQMAPADGAHTLSVRAVDLANNQTVEETSFTYDAPDGGGQGGTGGEGQSAPPPTADATAPRWTFKASRQRSAKTRRISFILTTNESCLLSVTAKLGRKRLGALTQPLAAGAPGAQRLTLSKKSLVALRKALRRKKTVTVTLAIACVDGAGNTSKANRRITVRR